MPGTLPRWVIASATALLYGCASPPTVAPAAGLELSPYVGRLRTIDVALGGIGLKMLFDTGAGLTLVTPAAATRLGCTPEGRTVGWRMNGERVDFPLCRGVELALGPSRRQLSAYGIFDLDRVLPAGLPRLDGVLGLDAFRDACLLLELGARQLQVSDAPCDTAVGAGWTDVPMRIATGVDGATAVVFLGVSAARGRTLWLELDSGNLDSVLLSPDAAAALGVPTDAQDAAVPLVLGTLATAPLPVATRDLIHEGALNAEFLERHDVRIDLGSRRAWLRRHRSTTDSPVTQ